MKERLLNNLGNTFKLLIALTSSINAVLVALLVSGLSAGLSAGEGKGDDSPYQANGVKVGEVSRNSAIIWTRLTKNSERKRDGIPFPDVNWKKQTDEQGDDAYFYPASQIPEGVSLDQMNNAVPGTSGEIRIVYWQEGSEDKEKLKTIWAAVDPDRDFTHQFTLSNLKPGASYRFEAKSRASDSGPKGQKINGSFRTAPAPDEPARVVFTVVTGQAFHRRDDGEMGHRIYPRMAELNPDFFVHTGDILYYDNRRPIAHSVELARLKWNRMYALPFQRDFHKHVTSYFMKDDHDTWQNDCWPTLKNDLMGDFTFKQGQAIFFEQVPMGERTYRTVRWGSDLQIWMVEGRDYRSPNTMPDGPDKTLWGEKQKKWFKRTVSQSNATFKILISPTALLGPELRENRNDNLSTKAFTHEGNELRNFIGQQKNMVIVCGDRHLQYVSVDPKTGIREYACGPTSDAHANDFRDDLRDPMHQYLNFCGGFLSATVERRDGKATLTFHHHSVDGTVLNEDQLTVSL